MENTTLPLRTFVELCGDNLDLHIEDKISNVELRTAIENDLRRVAVEDRVIAEDVANIYLVAVQ